MNTVTPETGRVHAFATAVREQMQDLSADEIEDLTDGLEADLVEQVADDATHDLGDPALYADELRSAAGLPARGESLESSTSGLGRALWAWCASWPHRAATRVRSAPVGAWMLDVLLLLRPVWWLLRGWAVFQFALIFISNSAHELFPTSGVSWLLLLAFVVGSIQWGRGRWMPWRWLRAVKAVLSVVAALSLPIFLGNVVTATNQHSSNAGISYAVPASGLALDGTQISNIFAYDAAGNPLTGIQLFDQNGNPVTTTSYPGSAANPAYADDGTAAYVPSAHSPGDTGWNVYPLNIIRLPLSGEADLTKATTAVPPFFKAQPLTDQTPTPTPTPAVPLTAPSPTTPSPTTPSPTTPSPTTAPTPPPTTAP